MPEKRPRAEETLSAAEVAGFLRRTPGFLRDNPGLYGVLEPPRRVHGERIADHMAALLEAGRGQAAAMAERADSVLAAGRAAAGLAARVQEAVLALLRAEDAVECIGSELPALLAIDAASLGIEGERRGARVLSPGAVAELMGGRSVVFRQGAAVAPLLHGEAARLARFEALVRVPGVGPAAVLALVSRDERPLDATQGAGALAFLGRAVAAALGR